MERRVKRSLKGVGHGVDSAGTEDVRAPQSEFNKHQVRKGGSGL